MKTRSTEVIDLSKNNFELYPENSNLKFGIIIQNNFGQPFSYDPTYFTLKMTQIDTSGLGTNQIETNFDLGIQDCTNTFPIISEKI